MRLDISLLIASGALKPYPHVDFVGRLFYWWRSL